MKNIHAWSVYWGLGLIGVTIGLSAAEQREARSVEHQARVLDRGAHHRQWENIVRRTSEDGSVTLSTNRYTELSSGLHYWEDAQWKETEEVIDIVPGGAMASRGPHKVGFAANINTPGAINFLTSDRQRLRSHVLGLAYTDSKTGQSVLIAGIKDSIGLLVSSNQIIYPDAFDDSNAVKADLRYTYTKAGFEQDVILLADPPEPELFGLDSTTTRLEVLTEFIEAPEPSRKETAILTSSDAVEGAGLVNENLSFGEMHMPEGVAFPLGESAASDAAIPTGKTWEKREGRTFLIEAVQYPSARPHLKKLDEPVTPKPEARAKTPLREARYFPAAPKPGPGRAEAKVVKMASLNRSSGGYVIDYTILSSSISTNFTFAGDTTYYISGNVTLNGSTNTVEGGAVIKNGGFQLRFVNNLTCKTAPGRPAFFTSKNDDSIGDTISGSTGNPWTNLVGSFPINLGGSSGGYFDLHDLRIWHLGRAIYGTIKVDADVRNVQVVHSQYAFKNNTGFWNLRNVLAVDTQYVFDGVTPLTNNVEHATFVGASNLVLSGLPAVNLTNSLLISVTNNVSYTGANVVSNQSSSGVFQQVGSGAYYLASGSTNRDTGTTNINATLLSELRQRTTYPPTVLSNLTFSADTNLAPVTLRDTDTPDLGYHYDTLDYLVTGLSVTNATLGLTNGVAVGLDYSSGSWGILLKQAKLLSTGGPTNHNYLVRAHLVQDKSSGNPATRALFYDGGSPNASNELRLRFTTLAQAANDGAMLNTGQKFTALEWTHSAVYNPSLTVDADGANTLVCGLTNTLWERGTAQFGVTNASANATVRAHNNLFKNSVLHLVGGEASWRITDNLVDGGGMDDHGTVLTNWYNAYYGATTNLSGGSANTNLASLSYLTGPLGGYYQPTNSVLINGGSQNATNAGLYHFTTTTNQVKETNSTVDIGLHYVALNADGSLPDNDSDGLADYWEDRNGNGAWDSGELNWQSANTDGDDMVDGLEIVMGRNPNGGTVSNTNNFLNLKVFTPLRP